MDFDEITAMFLKEQALAASDPAAFCNTALKVFFNITDDWELTTQDQIVLLGNPTNSTFHQWRNKHGPALPHDTLERISYVIGIYKDLRLLFPTEEQANTWLEKTNSAFDGSSALSIMLQGATSDLANVRRYLSGMRH